MSTKRRISMVIGLVLVGAMTLSSIGGHQAFADEGMWTFDNPPLKLLKERYGFTPSQEWLDHVRLASVRFNDGGSGSFVSPDGLVLTNHHVARGQLQKVSSPTKNYVKDGFYAKSAGEELKCPDLELNVLISMEDVTGKVVGSVKPGMSEQDALAARRAEIAGIEKESLDATGLRSDVIPLYEGSEYWLYRYKKYTDVRLVFAPEQQIAFYGGDPDNFTYPRYDLDIALFRVYEDGKAIHSTSYLRVNPAGVTDGELVFVSGNPGSTDRSDSMAQLEYLRDVAYPRTLKTLSRRLSVLESYAALGTEQAREANNLIFGLQNSVKALSGEFNGLMDKSLMAKKELEENEFRAMVDKDPQLKSKYGEAWGKVAEAVKMQVELTKAQRYRSIGRSLASLANKALTIVEYVAEVRKPDGERLAGFHEAQLGSLKFDLLSEAPSYPEMDTRLLADSLQESLEELGPSDPFVKSVLQGKSPATVASEAIGGTKLADAAFRRSLIQGGQDAVDASTDPLIQFARRVDPFVREVRKEFEKNVESIETSAGEQIGKARFAVYGKSTYPDATFTLRLSYGKVKGYPMNGTEAPPKTTLYGLYDRAYSFDMKAPFDLPERFTALKGKLDLSTGLDFVSTCDIIGGNSGSPVINRNGEFVGVIFDGNIESLVGRFVYDDRTNRAVSVDSAAIIMALRDVYDAEPLVDEMEGHAGGAAGR
ncbi:MAG TPA: S46 family peptidase [Blastocatellia bacterium]|nr:S46 family peptidase [Blastocatellia bacterium]